MKAIRVAVLSLSLAGLLTGCVTVAQYKFALDGETGQVVREYYDLASRSGPDEKDYSVTNDWAALKRMVADQEPEFDAEVVVENSKSLFATNDVLCARKAQTIKFPKAFPSKAALLSYVHKKDWRFEMNNEEVILFLPSGKTLVSTNGQKLATPNNTLIVWPKGTRVFEYVVTEQWAGGTSLLPCYLAEQGGAKPTE